MSNRQYEHTDHVGAVRVPITGQAGPAVPNNAAWGIKMPRLWPFKPDDSSPLAWWRRLPSGSFHDAERSLLLATLGNVNVLHGGDELRAALRGDAAAAIGAALGLMPIKDIGLQADIAMTALVRTALDGNAASALVMAQVVGLTDLGHPFATELAASWFAYGQQHSNNPRQFGQAEPVLLAAFREHQIEGKDEDA